MNRRRKQKEVFFTGFCVTLLLAAAFAAFLCVDYNLIAAGYNGGGFADEAISLWDQLQGWAGAAGEALKNGTERIVNFLKHFFQEVGNLLQYVGSVL